MNDVTLNDNNESWYEMRNISGSWNQATYMYLEDTRSIFRGRYHMRPGGAHACLTLVLGRREARVWPLRRLGKQPSTNHNIGSP